MRPVFSYLLPLTLFACVAALSQQGAVETFPDRTSRSSLETVVRELQTTLTRAVKPSIFVLEDGTLFGYTTTPMTWAESEKYCKDYKFKLAKIEKAQIPELIKEPALVAAGALWTAGKEKVDEAEFMWRETKEELKPVTGTDSIELKKYPDPNGDKYPSNWCLLLHVFKDSKFTGLFMRQCDQKRGVLCKK